MQVNNILFANIVLLFFVSMFNSIFSMYCISLVEDKQKIYLYSFLTMTVNAVLFVMNSEVCLKILTKV